MNYSVFRYSIASILFVFFVVAGMFAGYRAGFSQGYASGKAKLQSEEPFPRVYQVGDLMQSVVDQDESDSINNEPNIGQLMQAVQATVYPEEWQALGGPCTIAPLPLRKSLAVNATSGVHRRLESFFAEVSSVKTAVAKVKSEDDAQRRLVEEAVARALAPVEESLNEALEPIAPNADLIGSWDVRSASDDEHGDPVRYTFVDEDTVTMSSADRSQPVEKQYATSTATLMVSRTPYLAAWTADKELVLVRPNAPESILVATRVAGEQGR